MFFVASLTVAAAALAVSASPIESRAEVVSIPLTYHKNVKSIKNVVDQGRQKLLRANNIDAVSSGSVTNEDVTYVAPVSIGGTTHNLIVDTGSSNTWCGASGPCEPTSSGKSTGGITEVTYGSGEFAGTEYSDVVGFGGLSVKNQLIGAALVSNGFSGVDGIIGFGPVDLTADTVTNAATVPTFMDNLYKQGSIPTEVLGVSFRPEPGSSTDTTNGILTLGGTDSARYTGSLYYVPKLTTGAAAPYWGVSIANFAYGSKSFGSGTGIVDTGTTLIYVPTSVYNGFLNATGGTTDTTSGLSEFSKVPTQDFTFTLGSKAFPLTPSQYLVPQAQYSEFGLTSGKFYSYITSGGSSGVDCIIGQKFIENYYVAFDTTNSRLGFAPGTS